MARMGPLLEGLARCPNFRIAVPHLSQRYIAAVTKRKATLIPVWGAYECSSCNFLVTAMCMMDWAKATQNLQAYLNQDRPEARAVYPTPMAVDDDLPERPKRYLEQAINALNAPDGAVMLAGSAVDAMLKLKGYNDGSVYVRINQAVERGELTKDMSEWAHSVRLEANKPRHADLDEAHATEEGAKQSIEFAKALGDFMFVFPARVERGKRKSNEANQMLTVVHPDNAVTG